MTAVSASHRFYGTLAGTAGRMTVGQRQSTSEPLKFTGAVDDLVFFNRALTPAEIAQLANR